MDAHTPPCRVGAVESRAATNALLGELSSRGRGPSAWAHFGLATAARSLHQAADHPRAVAEVTAVHTTLAVLAGRGRRRWVGTSWLMAVTHLGLLGPARSIGAASTVTLIRANLPALWPQTPWLGAAAVLSDKADGYLARRAGPTQFGHCADSLADSAFWAWFAYRHEPDRRLVAAAAAAWVAPVAAVTALSVARGGMVDAPRPPWLRPAAAMQAVLAVRALHQAGKRRRRLLAGRRSPVVDLGVGARRRRHVRVATIRA